MRTRRPGGKGRSTQDIYGATGSPGKQSRSQRIYGALSSPALQRKGEKSGEHEPESAKKNPVATAAFAGVEGASAELPFANQSQASFASVQRKDAPPAKKKETPRRSPSSTIRFKWDKKLGGPPGMERHSIAVTFGVSRSSTMLSGKRQTSGGGAYAKGGLASHSATIKRSGGKFGGELATAFINVEAGVKPFPWLTVAIASKLLEAKWDPSNKKVSLALAKVGVSFSGTLPKAQAEKYFGHGLSVSIKGSFWYSLGPQDAARLARLARHMRLIERIVAKLAAKTAEKAKLAKRAAVLRAKRDEAKKLLEPLRKRQEELKKILRMHLENRRRAKDLLAATDAKLAAKKKELQALAKKTGSGSVAKRAALQDAMKTLEGRRQFAARMIGNDRAAIAARRKQLGAVNGKMKPLKEIVSADSKVSKELAEIGKKTRLLDKQIKSSKAIVVRAKQRIKQLGGAIKSRAGKVVAKQMERVAVKAVRKAVAKAMARAGAHLIPVVNVVMLAWDIADIAWGLYLLASGQARFAPGGGHGFKSGDKGGTQLGGKPSGAKKPPQGAGGGGKKAGGRGGSGKDTGAGSQGHGKGNTGSGGEGRGKSGGPEALSGDAKKGGTRGVSGKPDAKKGDQTEGRGNGSNEKPVDPYAPIADPDKAKLKLSAPVKLILEVLRGRGEALSTDDLRALNDQVPKKLPLDKLRKALKALGREKIRSADTLLGRLLQIVAAMHKGEVVTPNADKGKPNDKAGRGHRTGTKPNRAAVDRTTRRKLDYRRVGRYNRSWQARLSWSTAMTQLSPRPAVTSKAFANWVHQYQATKGLKKDGICGAVTTKIRYEELGWTAKAAYKRVLAFLAKMKGYKGRHGRSPHAGKGGGPGRSGSGRGVASPVGDKRTGVRPAAKQAGTGPAQLVPLIPPGLLQVGKDGRCYVDQKMLQHHVGKGYTHPSGLASRILSIRASVSDLEVSQGNPRQEYRVEIRAEVVRLPRNAGASYRWKLNDKASSHHRGWFEPKTRREGSIHSGRAIARALRGLMQVKGDRLELKPGMRGKDHDLILLTAAVVEARSEKAGKVSGGRTAYPVRATIIPKVVPKSAEGIIVGGRLRKFVKGKKMILPAMDIEA